MTAPLTSMKIALFDADSDGACRLASSLNCVLAESGMDARVMALGAVNADLDISSFDAFFLRGLRSSGSANVALQASDQAMRAALRQAETSYQVIYGSDDESMEQIVRAIKKISAAAPVTAVLSQQKTRNTDDAAAWLWLCDKCSDPQCEHRLLTGLLEKRKAGLTG
jgi:hypothetical protein